MRPVLSCLEAPGTVCCTVVGSDIDAKCEIAQKTRETRDASDGG